MQSRTPRAAPWDVAVTVVGIAGSVLASYVLGAAIIGIGLEASYSDSYRSFDLRAALWVVAVGCPILVLGATAWASARIVRGLRGWRAPLGVMVGLVFVALVTVAIALEPHG